MLQLNPSIPVDTPKGKGQAVILIDYSPEHDLCWVVFVDETRECWTFRNRDLRIQPNITFGRPAIEDAKQLPFSMDQFPERKVNYHDGN